MKISARHLRNKTLEVADNDVQDSATVTGKGSPSFSVVTNNDNDSHGPAQIQGMLADILSTLKSIQCQNAKANEKSGAKVMAENQKFPDRLREQLQREITKVTGVIFRLRAETRHEMQ
jgi:hypothetical protein